MVFEQYGAPAIAAQPARLLADWLRAYVGLVSRWRVRLLRAHGPPTATPDIIAAQNVADALEEVRARMAPTCHRAEVTQLPAPATSPAIRTKAAENLRLVAPTTKIEQLHENRGLPAS